MLVACVTLPLMVSHMLRLHGKLPNAPFSRPASAQTCCNKSHLLNISENPPVLSVISEKASSLSWLIFFSTVVYVEPNQVLPACFALLPPVLRLLDMLCASMCDGLTLASKHILPFARRGMASASSAVRLPGIQIMLSAIQNVFTLPLRLVEWKTLAYFSRGSDAKIAKMAFLEACTFTRAKFNSW